jgi:carboxypeptidase family protein
MRRRRPREHHLTSCSVPLIVVLTATFLYFPGIAWGQQVTASITGKVTDPSNAIIAGAKVTAKDLDRGTQLTTETNTSGFYNLPRVPIGRYEIRVEVAGFQTAVHEPVQLELNQAARVDVVMQLGEVTQTIEVTGASPLLQTDTMQLGSVIDEKTNKDLPLATRNYIQLTLLAPGSVNPNPQTLTNGQTTANGGRPYVNGNREQANNFLLDGLDNNQVSDNLVGYTPSPDAIQEFNMITNNAPADFGSFQGGVVSTTIKSGTNQLHGSAFEFFRNDVLNANTWENNWSGSPRAKVRWNMFGGSAGGPIIKDKLFFFGDYQGERFNNPATTNPISVFTAAERQGDFSQLLTERGIQLYNPFLRDANSNRVPFPNNQIPVELLDPVARALFASNLYPLPVNNGLQNNQFNTTSSKTVGDQFDVKIDANLSEVDHVFFRYSHSRQNNPSTNSFPLFFDSFFDAPTHNGVGNWTRTLSPHLVNEVRIGVNRVLVNNGGVDKGLGNVAEQLGIQNGNERGPGLLALNFGAALVNGIGSANIGTQQLFADTVYQYEDALVLTHGRHVVHSGFQYWRQQVNTFYAGNNGRTGFMSYTGKFTAGPSPLSVAGGGTGAGEADFLLGLPDQLGRGVDTGTWGQRSNVFAAYVQDNWRVTDSLTLNLGMRYETHTPWVEVKDRQSNFAPFTGEIETAGQSTFYSNNRALYNSYNAGLDFQPRFGFAWTPGILGKKTVLRGAYTISSFLEGTGTNLRLPLNPPFNQEFATLYDTLSLPASRTADGLTVLSSPTDPFSGATIRLWDPNVRPAAVQQWNFSVERQFFKDTTLTAGYVGQHGTHLMVPRPYFQRQLLPDGTTTPSPYLAGNPDLANIAQISGTESNGNQRYDALQATLQKRFSQGLQYQIAYTYSKCMTNSIGYYGSGGQAGPTSAYWQNLYDTRAEWGPCYFDVKSALTSFATYELPFGHGKKFGNNWNPWMRATLGNWKVSSIVSAHKGYPLTISAGDASGTNSRGSRADCIAPASVFGRMDSPSGGFQWFDPNSYGPPVPGTFGTCGVGTVRGPGLANLDLGLQKEFFVSEGKHFEFRTEFLNLTNTPILNAPDTSLGAGLGQLRTSQGPRNIQFGLKFYF